MLPAFTSWANSFSAVLSIGKYQVVVMKYSATAQQNKPNSRKQYLTKI